MHAQSKVKAVSVEQGVCALMLIVGLYLPTSTDGEHSVFATLIAFSMLLAALTYLAWKRGVRGQVFVFVSLPIVILPLVFTLPRFWYGPMEIDFGLLMKLSALGLVFALDLRGLRPGAFLKGVFVIGNLVNLIGGFAILIGSEWMAEFLPKYYWTAIDELVTAMVTLHKPVLTFGTHSLAAWFVYVFFWMNWEEFKTQGRRLSLLFALGYFVLLVGLTSFTALGLVALAAVQVTFWSLRHNPKLTAAAALSLALVIPLFVHAFSERFGDISELPQIADVAFLNSDFSGPIIRYGPGGVLRPAMNYLLDHPFSPMGLARSGTGESPTRFFLGDSGTLEFLLRGSFPLLLLVYVGLYLFLRNNLSLRYHVLLLFVVMIIFETGFELLIYFRTLYLLPFIIAYLNDIASAAKSEKAQYITLRESHSFSG